PVVDGAAVWGPQDVRAFDGADRAGHREARDLDTRRATAGEAADEHGGAHLRFRGRPGKSPVGLRADDVRLLLAGAGGGYHLSTGWAVLRGGMGQVEPRGQVRAHYWG